MVAAIATLTKDSNKLTLGQPLTIIAPHAVETIVRQPPDRWLSNAQMTHYQCLLLHPERVRFGPAVTLNPATLLPDHQEETSHDCQQILAEVHGTREDLTDQPLADAEVTWFTDGKLFARRTMKRRGCSGRWNRGHLGQRAASGNFCPTSRAHRSNASSQESRR